MNVQAICDHQMRFIYFSVAAPGRTGDARAIRKCKALQQWLHMIKTTPDLRQFFLVGDNAYVLDNQTVIAFSGKNLDEYKRTYNFYLSQLRIRIEMAFGRLTTKWRIFRRKLDFNTSYCSQICCVAAILHNYIINKEGSGNDQDIDVFHEDFGQDGQDRGYLATTQTEEEEADGRESADDSDFLVLEQLSIPTQRSNLLQQVISTGLRRPAHNVARNANNE